ncbi:MAG: septum formation initiator family protein [Bacteroidales bacterium]|jgi:cell division protein FtsB|nr:septum formation initiator family protein [Bacteroidales bacterium]
MNKVTKLFYAFINWKYKYIFGVSLFFVIWIFVLSPNNVYTQYRLHKELSELKKMENFYRKEIDSNRQKILLLKTDLDYAEKYGREEYLMKRENEDIYLIIHAAE